MYSDVFTANRKREKLVVCYSQQKLNVVIHPSTTPQIRVNITFSRGFFLMTFLYMIDNNNSNKNNNNNNDHNNNNNSNNRDVDEYHCLLLMAF